MADRSLPPKRTNATPCGVTGPKVRSSCSRKAQHDATDPQSYVFPVGTCVSHSPSRPRDPARTYRSTLLCDATSTAGKSRLPWTIALDAELLDLSAGKRATSQAKTRTCAAFIPVSECRQCHESSHGGGFGLTAAASKSLPHAIAATWTLPPKTVSRSAPHWPLTTAALATSSITACIVTIH